jgi:chromosome segregation ATPase
MSRWRSERACPSAIQIAEINAENLTLKSNWIQLEDVNRKLDTECQANRATLQQMSNQLSLIDQHNNHHVFHVDSMRAERDLALAEKDAMSKELDTVKARFESIQKAWQNARAELDQRESRYSSGELHLKQIENELTYVKSCFDAFKQQVGQLLSDGYVKVDGKEEEIKENIQLLMQSSKDRGLVSRTMARRRHTFMSSDVPFSFRSSAIYRIKRKNCPHNCKIS